MKILFIVSAFNGLSQRAWIELDRLNHQVKVHIAVSAEQMVQAVAGFDPELVIAPYLKMKIPREIFDSRVCLIVHPGIVGDRGSASLDWAILRQEKTWGVTILQAVDKMDAGPVWASETFAMRPVSKSCLYRHEVTQAAAKALVEAVRRFEAGDYTPKTAAEIENARGGWNRATRPDDFRIDWQLPTTDILTRIRAADSSPGAPALLAGAEYLCFGAHAESELNGRPGELLARRGQAVCVATADGAVWLTHLRRNEEDSIKLPATLVLGAAAAAIPENPCPPFEDCGAKTTYREIRYEEAGEVGYIHFDFYNGAMSAGQCRALQAVFTEATLRPTRVIVLMGGMDLWSNGIHLNVIEAADNPAECSWENILAIDDLIGAIIQCPSHYVISALHGNAGAGGVPFALAADKVIARKGIVLNPHTRNMGLYGSEYWTYLLPRRIGTERARQFTEQCLPWGTDIAIEVKLIDECLDLSGEAFVREVRNIAEGVARLGYFDQLLKGKQFKRRRDEAFKPLQQYRDEELEKMRRNFFDDDEQYDLKRFCFVHKQPYAETAGSLEQKDLFNERRKIWRRRKYEDPVPRQANGV